VQGASATGNEFHHIGMSADGTTVACGGLLSVLKGQDSFFFDVLESAAHRSSLVANPPLSANTDDFQSLPQGDPVTMMGGRRGNSPESGGVQRQTQA